MLKVLVYPKTNAVTVEHPKFLESLTRDALNVSNVYIAVLTARDSTGKMGTTNSANYW
jgi:serine/threonine-protein kinase RIO1